MLRFLMCVLLIGTFCPPKASGEPSEKLKKQLTSQHFSGLLTGNVRLTMLGQLSCGANSLQAIFYEWEQSSPPGAAVHASYRVILMQRSTYLGSYAVADKPSIRGDELKFPYTENGNSIKCVDGVPPKEVLLDGENISFAK